MGKGKAVKRYYATHGWTETWIVCPNGKKIDSGNWKRIIKELNRLLKSKEAKP